MSSKALVVIDIQNDITKHYRDIIDNINAANKYGPEYDETHKSIKSLKTIFVQHKVSDF